MCIIKRNLFHCCVLFATKVCDKFIAIVYSCCFSTSNAAVLLCVHICAVMSLCVHIKCCSAFMCSQLCCNVFMCSHLCCNVFMCSHLCCNVFMCSHLCCNVLCVHICDVMFYGFTFVM